jgi:hypothetical protein
MKKSIEENKGHRRTTKGKKEKGKGKGGVRGTTDGR